MAEPFQPKFVDLVRNITTTTGTQDFVLGPAMNGYSSFAQTCAVGDQFYYAAIGVEKPGEREVGRGTLLPGGVVSRQPVSGARTNFTAGTTAISLVAAAEWFAEVEQLRQAAQPIAVSDFKNGIYTLHGKPVTYDDLWQAVSAMGGVVPGVGWTFTKTGAMTQSYVPATPALNDALGPAAGFTAVIDCAVDTPDVEGSGTVLAGIGLFSDELSADVYSLASLSFDPPSWGGSGGYPPYVSTTDAWAYQYVTLGDVHRFAAALGPTNEYISVNGGPVQQAATPNWSADLNAIHFLGTAEGSLIGPQRVIIERIAFFPLLEPERLPELSARPLTTPSGVPERIVLARALGSGVVLGQSAEPVSHSGDTNETVLAKVTIPASAMGENGRIFVEALFSHSPTSNVRIPRIKVGGIAVSGGFGVNPGGASSKLMNSIHNRASQKAQVCLNPIALGPTSGGTSAPPMTMTVDTTGDVDVTFTGQLGVASDTIAVESYQVVLYPRN